MGRIRCCTVPAAAAAAAGCPEDSFFEAEVGFLLSLQASEALHGFRSHCTASSCFAELRVGQVAVERRIRRHHSLRSHRALA